MEMRCVEVDPEPLQGGFGLGWIQGHPHRTDRRSISLVVWSVPGEFAWDGVGVQPSSGMQKGIYLTTWKQITSFFKGESFFHTGIKLKKINIAAHGPLAQKSRSIRMAAVEEWQKHAHKKGEDGAAQQISCRSFDGAYFVDKKLMEPEGEERWPEPPAAQPRQPGIYIVG